MVADTLTLQIRVWRPSRHVRNQMNVEEGGPIKAAAYHEEVYAWETSEDLFGGVTNVEQSDAIRELLIERFAPGNSPSSRKITHLCDALTDIDKILDMENVSDWGDAKFVRILQDGERLGMRQHCLLALRHQLQWLCDIFSPIPDVFITVR